MRASFIAKLPTFILYGPPGCGKGTYGKMLEKRFTLPYFSLGDYLRSLTPCTVQYSHNYHYIRKCLEEGKLISDSIADEIIDGAIKLRGSIILDGYPRTISQALHLNKVSSNCVVLHFHLPDEIIIKKLLGRLQCPICGEHYNTADIKEMGYRMPPMNPNNNNGLCDLCKCMLLPRNDDDLEVIKSRLNEFHCSYIRMMEYFCRENTVLNFDLKNGIDDMKYVYHSIEQMINSN